MVHTSWFTNQICNIELFPSSRPVEPLYRNNYFNFSGLEFFMNFSHSQILVHENVELYDNINSSHVDKLSKKITVILQFMSKLDA